MHQNLFWQGSLPGLSFRLGAYNAPLDLLVGCEKAHHPILFLSTPSAFASSVSAYSPTFIVAIHHCLSPCHPFFLPTQGRPMFSQDYAHASQCWKAGTRLRCGEIVPYCFAIYLLLSLTLTDFRNRSVLRKLVRLDGNGCVRCKVRSAISLVRQTYW